MSNKIKQTPKIPIILFINSHVKEESSICITNYYAFLTHSKCLFFPKADIFFQNYHY